MSVVFSFFPLQLISNLCLCAIYLFLHRGITSVFCPFCHHFNLLHAFSLFFSHFYLRCTSTPLSHCVIYLPPPLSISSSIFLVSPLSTQPFSTSSLFFLSFSRSILLGNNSENWVNQHIEVLFWQDFDRKQNCYFMSTVLMCLSSAWLWTEECDKCYLIFSSSSFYYRFHFSALSTLSLRSHIRPNLFHVSLLSPLPRLPSPWLRWSLRQWSERGWHLLRVSCSPSRRLPGLLWHDHRWRRLDGESEENGHTASLLHVLQWTHTKRHKHKALKLYV